MQDSRIPQTSLWLFGGLGLVVLLSVLLAAALEEWLVLGLPAVCLLVYQTVVDFRKVFFLLLFCIPLSTEFYLPSGLGTDLPTEPLVLGLMLAYGLYLIPNWKSTGRAFLSHPLTGFLFLHLAWMGFTVFTSSDVLVSVKFMLAKIWYVAVYFFLAGKMLKTPKDFKRFFWVIFTPFLVAVLVTVYRHSGYGFSFADVKYVMQPCFRNHVLYAAIMAVFFPFICVASLWYSWRNPLKWLLIFSALFFLLAIYLSYTRTAYVALLIAFASYFAFRWKLMKIATVLSIIVLTAGIWHIMQDNQYLEYAPDFEKTISHQDFDDLLNATSKGQDVSTMERVYRWVAAMQMGKEQTMTGYGPGNFYNFYKSHAVTSFETYVSENPEKSGIHCYYLMMLTDQGLPGALIFLGFTFFVLIYGEKVYHETKDGFRKQFVMAILLSLVIIDAFLLINDMLETDKIGSFYFINLAMLVNVDLWNRRAATSLLAVNSQ